MQAALETLAAPSVTNLFVVHVTLACFTNVVMSVIHAMGLTAKVAADGHVYDRDVDHDKKRRTAQVAVPADSHLHDGHVAHLRQHVWQRGTQMTGGFYGCNVLCMAVCRGGLA